METSGQHITEQGFSRCDLHTHSVFSDGTYTPRELLEAADNIGLSAIVLCDHNTVSGLDEFVWAGEEILPSHSETENEDGTKTFTIQIASDLTFSNGSPITAENYVVGLLAGSSAVMKEAGGGDAAGLTVAGYEAFNAYTGEGDPVPFAGVRLLNTHTFSITVKKEYAQYYYALLYGSFTPEPTALYLGDYKIKDDGQGAYIEKGFYDKSEKNGVQSYTHAAMITANMNNTSNAAFP